MSDYNIEKLKKPELEDCTLEPQPETKPNYLMAFLAGLGTSVIVAIILAILAMWLEAEYWYALIIGATLVGAAIHSFVPKNSPIGGLLGGILCPATYFIYQEIMAFNGYAYEDEGYTFWWMLGGSFIIGLFLGSNRENND